MAMSRADGARVGRSSVSRWFERRVRAGAPPAAGLPSAGGRRRPRWRLGRVAGLVPSSLLALPALVPAVWPAVARRLEYDRPRIGAGELWRVATCHWTHWSLDHLLWDLGMLVLLAALCWRLGRGRTVAAVASAAALIPLALWLLSPDLERYRGLSGLDAALFVLLAAGLLRRDLAAGRRRSVALPAALLLAFAGKVVYEAATGATLFVDSAADFVPVPLAHLVGGACGGVAAALGTRPPASRTFPALARLKIPAGNLTAESRPCGGSGDRADLLSKVRRRGAMGPSRAHGVRRVGRRGRLGGVEPPPVSGDGGAASGAGADAPPRCGDLPARPGLPLRGQGGAAGVLVEQFARGLAEFLIIPSLDVLVLELPEVGASHLATTEGSAARGWLTVDLPGFDPEVLRVVTAELEREVPERVIGPRA